MTSARADAMRTWAVRLHLLDGRAVEGTTVHGGQLPICTILLVIESLRFVSVAERVLLRDKGKPRW